MKSQSAEHRSIVSEDIALELRQLAVACRILESEGHGSRTLGHVAMRDPAGRGFWLKRSGIGLGEVFFPTDFVLLAFDGAPLNGDNIHREWPMHAAVFEARPEIRFSAHTHAFHCRVFSSVSEPLQQVSSVASYFAEPPPRFEETSDLIDTRELGHRMALSLGSHYVLFLRNHGVFFCAETIEQMVTYGLSMEEACREFLLISASGLAWSGPPRDELQRKAKTLGGKKILQLYWEFLQRQLASSETQR
jgi:ribulose-5-phosphate 4-epimerase/fuculose-1-phosphate aldolase